MGSLAFRRGDTAEWASTFISILVVIHLLAAAATGAEEAAATEDDADQAPPLHSVGQVTITATPAASPCHPDDAYSLPAGPYELVLPIHVFDSVRSEGDVSDRVLLPRLPVELP